MKTEVYICPKCATYQTEYELESDDGGYKCYCCMCGKKLRNMPFDWFGNEIYDEP